MKVNDLTEENIKELKDGSYAIFDEKGIRSLVSLENKCFIDSYPYIGWHIAEFKREFKNCEMFPIELIKKPGENNNEN